MPKVDEIDFKGNSVSSEAGQAETTEVKEESKDEVKSETKVEEPETEDVESLKARLKKAEEDKENYKEGMLKYKKLSLEPEKKEEVEEEGVEEKKYPIFDDNSQLFQEQTVSMAEKIAETKAKQIVEKYNENAAISKFLSNNPEAEGKWNDIISNYHPKNGKESIYSIIKDLDRAYYLTKYELGEGENKEAKQQLDNMSTVSRTTVKNPPKGDTLSQTALKMAGRMRVDLDKLAKEDDSLTAETNF